MQFAPVAPLTIDLGAVLSLGAMLAVSTPDQLSVVIVPLITAISHLDIGLYKLDFLSVAH